MKIFFATPISKLIDPHNGLMREEPKEILRLVYEKINDLFEAEIFFAAKEEKWGEVYIDDSECVLRDVEKLKESDLIIAIIFGDISEGVLIELGWASAMNKTIECIVDTNVTMSKLVRGLSAITNFNVNRIDFSSNIQDFDWKIEKVLREIMGRIEQKNIVFNFFEQWEKHNMFAVLDDFDTNIELIHPYFDKAIIGRQDVISCLNKINLDFEGKIKIVLYHNISNSVVEIKFNEGNNAITDKLSQNIVTRFEFINNRITKIHFVGVELFLNGYENKVQKAFHTFKSNEDVINALVQSWSENNFEKFYSLFDCNAMILHPIYINKLSPDMFFLLMNSNVNVTSLVKEIELISDLEEEKTMYKVVIEEKNKLNALDVSEMIVYVTFKNLQILEMKIIGMQ